MNLKMIKVEGLERAPEILLYFMIEGLGDFLWAMRRAVMRYGADPSLLESEDVNNARHDQKAIVEMLKTREGFNFADHDEYLRWYQWWNHWHKHQLTGDQWAELNQMIDWNGTQTEETFAKWRPEGSWKEDPSPCQS